MKSKDKKHIGLDLRAYLKRHGIMQVHVCRRLKISTTIFNEILSGKRTLSVDIAIKLEDNFIGKAKTWLSKQLEYDIYNYKAKKVLKRPKSFNS